MSLRQGLGLAAMAFALATAASLKAFAAAPGVVATAPAGTGAPVLGAPPANDATGSQITAWVATDGDSSQPRSDTPPPRAIHGEVGAGVGTGGYRSVYGVADIPVGQTGDLIVAGSSSSGQVRGGRYGGQRDALALGFSSNGAPGSASGCGRPLWGQAWPSPSPTPIACSSPPQP